MARSRLKVILAEKDVSQKELAIGTGLSYSTISAIVNGRKPTLDNAYKISDYLRMHVDRVFPNLYSYAQQHQARTRTR